MAGPHEENSFLYLTETAAFIKKKEKKTLNVTEIMARFVSTYAFFTF